MKSNSALKQSKISSFLPSATYSNKSSQQLRLTKNSLNTASSSSVCNATKTLKKYSTHFESRSENCQDNSASGPVVIDLTKSSSSSSSSSVQLLDAPQARRSVPKASKRSDPIPSLSGLHHSFYVISSDSDEACTPRLVRSHNMCNHPDENLSTSEDEELNLLKKPQWIPSANKCESDQTTDISVRDGDSDSGNEPSVYDRGDGGNEPNVCDGGDGDIEIDGIGAPTSIEKFDEKSDISEDHSSSTANLLSFKPSVHIFPRRHSSRVPNKTRFYAPQKDSKKNGSGTQVKALEKILREKEERVKHTKSMSDKRASIEALGHATGHLDGQCKDDHSRFELTDHNFKEFALEECFAEIYILEQDKKKSFEDILREISISRSLNHAERCYLTKGIKCNQLCLKLSWLSSLSNWMHSAIFDAQSGLNLLLDIITFETDTQLSQKSLDILQKLLESSKHRIQVDNFLARIDNFIRESKPQNVVQTSDQSIEFSASRLRDLLHIGRINKWDSNDILRVTPKIETLLLCPKASRYIGHEASSLLSTLLMLVPVSEWKKMQKTYVQNVFATHNLISQHRYLIVKLTAGITGVRSLVLARCLAFNCLLLWLLKTDVSKHAVSLGDSLSASALNVLFKAIPEINPESDFFWLESVLFFFQICVESEQVDSTDEHSYAELRKSIERVRHACSKYIDPIVLQIRYRIATVLRHLEQCHHHVEEKPLLKQQTLELFVSQALTEK